MIFVTVGSQKFQFNRLLEKVDLLIDDELIHEKIFAQIGASDYQPRNYDFKDFLNRDEFNERVNNCEIMITHGGTGTIIKAVKNGKKVIAVPRRKEFGEHVDNHQLQLIRQFYELGLIEMCENMDRLADSIVIARTKAYKGYESNASAIVNSIEDYLSKF